jgi:uncharacterized membrane protein
MHEWLILATNLCATAIQWVALITVTLGAAEAVFRGVLSMFASKDSHVRPDAWLRLGRWLVAGLTFQLAADILETAITTSWEEVGRLAAIAAIRTALNFFLERDLDTFREREAAAAPGSEPRGAEGPTP